LHRLIRLYAIAELAHFPMSPLIRTKNAPMKFKRRTDYPLYIPNKNNLYSEQQQQLEIRPSYAIQAYFTF
jgi:hypothetical protein